MKTLRFIIGLLAASLTLCSCSIKPTYTRENVSQGLRDILLKDFDIDALVKVNGQTLGVCITLPRLLTASQKFTPIVTDIIQDISLCIKRVLFSADAGIQFFQINLRGKDTNMELGFIRYLRDYKILMMSGISIGDYNKRMVIKNEINIPMTGKKRLENFFYDLGKKKSDNLLSQHFTGDIKQKNISTGFVTWLWESLMKMNIQHEILDIRMIAADEITWYFYCKVRETFTPKYGFENYSFTTYSGGTIEYVFEMLSPNFYSVLINQIFLMNDLKEKDSSELKPITDEFGNPAQWPESDFHVYRTTLNEFLAQQIAGRIYSRLLEEKTDVKDLMLPRIVNIRGLFEEGCFKFLFIYSDKKTDVLEQDANVALETAKDVCELYKFKECRELKLGTPFGAFTSYTM